MKNRVREVRQYFGISLNELARRTSSGAATISDIESGKSVPSVILAIKIARELYSTVEELFGGDVEGGKR